MPIQSGDDLMQLGKLKFSIDSIENIYYLNNTKINGVSHDIISEIKSRMKPNETFIFNILHHELNENIISIEKDTSITKYGGISNYIFVIKKDELIVFDKYEEIDFNPELIASDYKGLTRSKELSYSLKSKVLSNLFSSTLKKIEGSKRVYIYATDFLSWLNLDVLIDSKNRKEKIEETEFIYLTNPIGFNSQFEQFNPKSISLFGASNFNTKLNYFSEKHKPIGIIGIRLNQVVFDLEKKSIIEEVTSGYPASISGIKVGDEIVSINGVKIDTINQFYKVNEMIRGDVNTELKLEVKRDNIFINFNIIRKDFYLEYQEKYEYLPGTEIEVSSIEKYLKTFNNVEVEKFVGSNSTEDNLRQQLKSEILHIATHSFVVDRESQIKKYDFTPINGVYAKNLYGNVFFENGLVFSGVNQFNLEAYNGKLNNGFLYSGEIENLDLRNVKLVVLSACESGIADESIFSTTGGIVNALGKAGAKSAIVSLWKVDDNVTKEFMLCFYKNLIYYKNTSIALRQTKLEIRKIHPEPYYWAPFVLYMLN